MVNAEGSLEEHVYSILRASPIQKTWVALVIRMAASRASLPGMLDYRGSSGDSVKAQRAVYRP